MRVLLPCLFACLLPHHPVSGRCHELTANHYSFIYSTNIIERLPNAGNHTRHRGFNCELLLLISSGPLNWQHRCHLMLRVKRSFGSI